MEIMLQTPWKRPNIVNKIQSDKSHSIVEFSKYV